MLLPLFCDWCYCHCLISDIVVLAEHLPNWQFLPSGDEQGVRKNTLESLLEPLQERSKEHQKAHSPIFDHCNTSGHNININNFTTVGREDQNLTRAIKEALFIRVNDPSLNRNIGKYHLPHIWDEVLHETSELKLKTLTQWPFPLPLWL